MERVSVKLEQLIKNSIERLNNEILVIENKIKDELKKFYSIKDLKDFTFEMLKKERTKEFNRIKKNIKKFR